ncbi:MAG: gluconeogenesis factor YvcK family protein [Candidatus Rokuibacteriota bacterium]
MRGHGGRDGGQRIVAVGGGTGLPVVLTALKRYLGTRVADLTAVVTVTDDGGSSGRLREELSILPPGDIRNCLVALAEVEPLMAELFQFRFGGDGALAGHSFGNLFLAALAGVTGSFLQAIRISGKVLAVRGTILPSTLESVRLGAELADGTRVRGESTLARQGQPIRRVFLEPGTVRVLPEVLEAIDRAHAIVLAPGSLYTSLVPNLLIGGLTEALRQAAALRIYVANLMTEPGETDGLSLADHLEVLQAHAGRGVVDGVVVHGRAFPADVLRRYEKAGAHPVAVDRERVHALGMWVTEADLTGRAELARHHPEKLGRVMMRLIREGGPARGTGVERSGP